MVTRIKVGSEVVPGHLPINSSLDLEHPLSRDTTLLPFHHRSGAHPKPSGELGLRDDPENRLKGRVLHLRDYIHRRFMRVNRWMIAMAPASNEHQRVVDVPKPEHYPNFPTWLDAAMRAFGITKAALAEIAGVKPQAVTKWVKGGNVGPEPLSKIADWSGVPYEHLRLRLEGQPIQTMRHRRDERPPNPVAIRIMRKVETLLEGDEERAAIVEELIDSMISRTTKARKRG